MLTVASLLWDSNDKSFHFSRCYDEQWVIRLYEGFKRNLTVPWRFVLWTDRQRDLPDTIKQERFRTTGIPNYGWLIEPLRYGCPMMLVGLDTVIVKNIDHLAKYCLEETKIALPRDPYRPERACNGVSLIPEGQHYVYRNWHGENDMEWMRAQPHVFIDDLFPGQVISYKVHVKVKPGDEHLMGRKDPMPDARIIYFHGEPKMHELTELPWIKQHWLNQI